MTAEVTFFQQITDLLYQSSSPQAILDLHASPEEEHRYAELTSKFQNGTLTEPERSELAKFEAVEHLVRMAKIKAFVKKNKG